METFERACDKKSYELTVKASGNTGAHVELHGHAGNSELPEQESCKSTLAEDLETYAHELYTRRDLKAGIQLISEISGVVAVGGLLLTILTSWLPAIGIAVPTFVIVRCLYLAACAYNDLGTKERRQIRAVVSWLHGGFSLGNRLVGG
jgi:hypothetical protein